MYMQLIWVNKPKTLFTFLVLTIFSLFSTAQKPVNSDLFGRKYKKGEISRYKLTTQEYRNGKLEFVTHVVCELTVVYDTAGIPYEEVRWISKIMMGPRDTTDQTKEALAVKPYRISLDARGRLDIPKIEVPAMTGAIEDFNTFFVAVSPLLGATVLQKQGDTFLVKNPIKADFSNGSTILRGDDCFSVLIKMTGKQKKNVVLYTAFMPPPQPCFTYILDEMNKPVVNDTTNNFQMVQPVGNDKFNVQYGREMFYINSTVRKKDGKITFAEMSNSLTLHLKVFCDKNYATCQAELPFAEQRILKLELLEGR
jgi:hypothetical protein